MTIAEWKERCAARYMENGGLTAEQAKEFADACFETQDGDFSETALYSPEDCADADMSYWASDAG